MGFVRRCVVAFAALTVGAAVLVPHATAPLAVGATVAPMWTVQPSTNRAGVSNTLDDVACETVSTCVAVGEYHNDLPSGPTPAGSLIETLSSGTWKTNASPGQGGLSRLLSVSCPTATRCYAIGTSHTGPDPLIVTKSGGAWSTMASPPLSAPSAFASISCGDETHCVAVGFAGPIDANPVILSLANGVWTEATLPVVDGTDFTLRAVSCVSAARCIVVGQRWATVGRTLVLKLAAGAWTVMPTTNRTLRSNSLNGVDCSSATRCTAIGTYLSASNKTRTLIAALDGTAWTLVPSPNRGLGHHALVDISCVVASRCVAIGIDGNGRTLILRLVGGVWTIDPGPQELTDYALFGVDCISASICVAVGSRPSANPFIARTLVVRTGGS